VLDLSNDTITLRALAATVDVCVNSGATFSCQKFTGFCWLNFFVNFLSLIGPATVAVRFVTLKLAQRYAPNAPGENQPLMA
jgi:hypothetical protein